MRILLALAAILIISTFGSAEASYRGGSNFGFYNLNGCSREPYGVLKNYHLKRAEIDDVLITMRAAGQARLRIPIFHYRNAVGGTNIPSNGGNFSAQYRNNLANLLATVKAFGFEEVVISFFPQAENNPVLWTDTGSWTPFHEDIFQENWNLIYHLMPIIQSSGVPYLIDLGNELSPPSSNYAWNYYAWKMWKNYELVFGRDNTVGFSLPSASSRASNMRRVYGNTPPYVFDVHIYDDAYNAFRGLDKAMDKIGYKVQGWIVGESYYNDDLSANQISQASANSNRTVFFVTQWPLTRARTCSDVDVVPELFNNYINYGF